MFLDPDPKGRDRAASPTSPFFASQSPIPSPRLEQSWRIKRSPQQEHSPTFKHQQQRRSTSTTATADNEKPTVRLVTHSPVPTPKKGTDSENVASRNQDWAAVQHAPPHTSLLASYQPASASETGSPAASRVSEEDTRIARAQRLDLPPAVTLLPSTYPKHAPEPSRATRRSTSSKYSGSGISNSTDAFDSSFTGSESSRIGRLSDRSTLDEEEIPEPGDDIKGSSPLQSKAPALETVLETSPDRSTAPSVSSNYKGQDISNHRELQSLSPERAPQHPRTYPALPWAQQAQPSPQDSLGSLPASSLSLPHSLSRPLTGQDSQETLAYDSYDYPQSSSPNFIAYSHSTSSRQPESPIHHAVSYESIQERLDNSSAFRPTSSGSPYRDGSPAFSSTTFNSPAFSSPAFSSPAFSSPAFSSPARHQRSSSADSLPPLHSPKRRLQNQDKPRPLSMDITHEMDYEEIDLEPWPRQPFSSHLSTIASESDRAMSPAQFSHFSMGSGVLTIDDAYSIPMSATMSRHSGALSSFSMGRRASEPLQSPSRKLSPEHPPSSEEEAGDMTLGVYRAESAKPEPLFKGREVTPGGDVRYNGPLPPLPPMPNSRGGNGDENSDSLSALSAPSLKKKRSGYSVRGRSNSTPSGSGSRHNSIVSYCDSERWSKGSSLFPIWAKNFYGGYAALLSASKISLTNPPTPRREPAQTQLHGHVRNTSQWTQGSITSRLGTGYSEIDNVSPTSSHFLPSIFRPRTRTLGASDNESRSFKFGGKAPKRKTSQPLTDSASRPDSMAINSEPLDQNHESGDTLPSGHPRFGTLKDKSAEEPAMPPLPRKYSKQRLWDEMTFPRPMTKDRLSDFKIRTDQEDSPHLSPNKNQPSQINKWRSPSFVESFDTLFNSRGNRQILLFALGFLCPFFWLLGALLPLPPRHSRDAIEAEKALPNAADSEDDLKAALHKHRSGDARLKWDEERMFLKAKWWRTLNRVMCFVGVGIIAAVIALAVIATR